jgi:hypothetical protein
MPKRRRGGEPARRRSTPDERRHAACEDGLAPSRAVVEGGAPMRGVSRGTPVARDRRPGSGTTPRALAAAVPAFA